MAGTLQAEVVAQRRALVIGPEQAAFLKEGHHKIGEIREPLVEIGRHDVEAVRRSGLEPVLQRVRHALGGTAQHPMPACGGDQIVEVAKRHALAPGLGQHHAGEGVIGVCLRQVRDGTIEIVSAHVHAEALGQHAQRIAGVHMAHQRVGACRGASRSVRPTTGITPGSTQTSSGRRPRAGRRALRA